MNAQEFRRYGKEAVDFIADYLETIRDRPVLPAVEPGYLQHMVPQEAPEEGEPWEDIFRDVDRVVMPGVTHWQSPHFHAYYPAGHSYPSILGEMISSGLGIVGFTWKTNPAIAELEVVVMNWLGKLIGLPDTFLSSVCPQAGGIIQGSASETILVSLLSAKQRTLVQQRRRRPEWSEDYIRTKMVAYSSDEANSAFEKACRLAAVRLRLVPADERCRLRGEALRKALCEDISNGLIPTYVCATLGTTSTCAFDKLDEIGPVCREHDTWLHVDAAYAGAVFVCPEYRHLMAGVEMADSFNFNVHKWLLVNFDCSAFWMRNASDIVNTFDIERIYLKKRGNASAPDYSSWEISLGRRFRALKLWFTIRSYGAKGLQQHIRNHISLAEQFERMVVSDSRFELFCESSMAVVCFRLKGANFLSEQLVARVNARRKIYLLLGCRAEVIFVPFVVSARTCELSDLRCTWREIQAQAGQVLRLKLTTTHRQTCSGGQQRSLAVSPSWESFKSKQSIKVTNL